MTGPPEAERIAERIAALRSVERVRRLVRQGDVRAIRETAGVTQAEVATVVGCTPSAIAHYEAGLRIPGREAALRYGAVLDALRSAGDS